MFFGFCAGLFSFLVLLFFHLNGLHMSKFVLCFLQKKEEEQDFACSCYMNSSQSLYILFPAEHFYNHYCNVCMLIFFYKHALPFSVLLRKLPLHIRRH